MAAHSPVWLRSSEPLETGPLVEDLEVDVCVIGGGIAGLTTAYLLVRGGGSVAVLDSGPLGGGETGRTTAHLSNALDDRYYNLERLHGASGAKDAAESHTAAIDCIASITAREHIECDFQRVDGFLFAPPNGSQAELERELAAAKRAGLGDVEFVERAPIPGFETGRCLRFPRQAQFDPMRYLDGLARAIKRRGGKIFTSTHAESLGGTSTLRVRTESGRTVAAKSVVMATNAPVWDAYGLFTLQAAYRTYAIGARLQGSMKPALFWDTADPYHYVRVAGEVLIIGGEDHRTGQDEETDRFARLEDWARERFPIGSVQYQWSGQVLEPVDGMAFIGKYPMSASNLFVATGDSGHGMTHGTITGILLTDLIQGKRNHWSTLYDPSRITASALGEYTAENLNVVAQYKEWVTGADVDSIEQIAPGSGGTVRHGAQKTAVFRELDGTYCEFSAVCPHLGGIVAWNESEKSWDCPCHGSRFDCHGHVLNGPANRGLDRRQTLAPIVTTARTGLQTAALMTANGLKKLLTLGIRIGA